MFMPDLYLVRIGESGEQIHSLRAYLHCSTITREGKDNYHVSEKTRTTLHQSLQGSL